MTPIRIFVSSVQREFSRERAQLRDYLRGDPLMWRFFEIFLVEDIPASDRQPDEVYLGEVERCDIYVGLSGTSTDSRTHRASRPRSEPSDLLGHRNLGHDTALRQGRVAGGRIEVGAGFVARIWRPGDTTQERRDTAQETVQATQKTTQKTARERSSSFPVLSGEGSIP